MKKVTIKTDINSKRGMFKKGEELKVSKETKKCFYIERNNEIHQISKKCFYDN